MPEHATARRRLLVLSFAAVLLAILAAGAAGPIREPLTAAVGGFGGVAPVAYVLAYALLSLMMVPGSFLTVLGGLLFGPWMGTAVAVVGGAIGATAAFAIGRRLGRHQVKLLSSGRWALLDEWLEQRGALAIAVARIVPGMPYTLLNYAAGVTGISGRDYVLGTLVGLVPGGFAYATLGGTLHDPLSPAFAGAVALVLTVIATGWLADRRLRRRRDRRRVPGGAAS